MSSINNSLSSNYLQSILSNALQNPAGTTGSTGGASTASVGQPADSGQLSPLSQLLSTLQQLQQSNPTEYAAVTKQVATNLTAAAQTATQDGNTAAANQLTTLATDFTNASTSGQLPNIQDLAQAVGGGHHHGGHHHAHGASSDSDSTTTDTTSTSSATTSSPLSQLLASLQSTGPQSDSLNPAEIIFNTLASAGLTNSGS